ncbi:class I SAM-dependent methyltransferase [Frankia sp. AiPs1]|uniref:class I SAM-dependent DNA methyltransferase n=1 Tax=Frankia sp. AiPs1 TaxID=573493 RepID=UPI0020444F91|nr:class I SAM-dependent methyltransferase [Frankia sp. AiPs1]MCM3925530.1 class I SAM-dependent methyltransferase [Frankia sp. AiPs1]
MPPATTRWETLTAGRSGRSYADRFARLAATGVDLHGEATFCHALVAGGSRVLDAGCGTGRVAIRLAELGHRCVGVDVDPSMLDVARDRSTAVRWVLADLAALAMPAAFAPPDDAGAPAATDGPFDLIVAAGNVIALLAPGTEAAVLHELARRLAPGGRLVAGFGLDAAHLPLPATPFGLADYDGWCAAAGLTLERRFATWQGTPFETGDGPRGRGDRPVAAPGYAVSVHRA